LTLHTDPHQNPATFDKSNWFGGKLLEDPDAKYCRPCDYAARTHAHRRRLFRFSHLRRLTLARDFLDVGPESRVLDYGSGDGYLLELLLPHAPIENFTAIEPFDFLQAQLVQRFGERIRIMNSSLDLASASFDRIACLEVLEHLQPNVVQETLAEFERLLAPDGILVVSVPIEVGSAVLFKYVAAMALTRMDRRYSIPELARATLGLQVRRDPTMKFLPHKGFDFRETRRFLGQRFRMERETFSPVSWLGWALNAQVVWRFRHR
jgi:2-polyprenyl-3-methyl-5-hydroxy-6-metoxy-1,4-benzoquinol methylase